MLTHKELSDWLEQYTGMILTDSTFAQVWAHGNAKRIVEGGNYWEGADAAKLREAFLRFGGVCPGCPPDYEPQERYDALRDAGEFKE